MKTTISLNHKLHRKGRLRWNQNQRLLEGIFAGRVDPFTPSLPPPKRCRRRWRESCGVVYHPQCTTKNKKATSSLMLVYENEQTTKGRTNKLLHYIYMRAFTVK